MIYSIHAKHISTYATTHTQNVKMFMLNFHVGQRVLILVDIRATNITYHFIIHNFVPFATDPESSEYVNGEFVIDCYNTVLYIDIDYCCPFFSLHPGQVHENNIANMCPSEETNNNLYKY